MKKIETLTLNPSIDTSTSVAGVVANRKLRCKAPIHEPGGGGINVSRAIARLGGRSLAIHSSGGENGKRFERLLDEEGINHSGIPISDMTRENFMVYDESNGQQYRFGMPGPALTDMEWKRFIEELFADEKKADYIVLSGSVPTGVPDEFFSKIVAMATKKGSRLVVDTSGQALREAAKVGVYMIKPNIRELQDLVGEKIENEDQQIEAASSVVNNGGAEIVIVSLGPQGVLLVTEEGYKRLRAPSVSVRSRVGAGDSMVGGVVLSLGQGKTLKEALLFGIAAGTAAVITQGSELCRREDTLRLYDQLKARNSGKE